MLQDLINRLEAEAAVCCDDTLAALLREAATALRAQLAAAREAVKGLPYMEHSEYCSGWEDLGDFAGCDCSAGSFNDTIESARRAVGLEG